MLRDNWTCRICGKRGGKLEVHHIQKLRFFPRLAIDTKNGVTLCVPCHDKVKDKKFKNKEGTDFWSSWIQERFDEIYGE
jgi:5-methylcytosine-specific restriction endonuclease McrA